MSSLVTNMPLLWVVVIIVGIGCIIYSTIKIMSDKTDDSQKYTENASEDKEDIKELFSYFLEEEERKNQDIRQLLKESINKNTDKNVNHPTTNKNDRKSKNTSDELYVEIMKYYSEGKSEDWIAKKLKKGVGEVKLVISLYNMK